MANTPCPVVIDCECVESPFANTSAEGIEANFFIARHVIIKPPTLFKTYSQSGCKRWCYSTISQADADACALAQATECVDDTVNPPPNVVVPPVVPPVGYPVVNVDATEPVTHFGDDPGVFTLTRTGSLAGPLTIQFALSGSATNGVDYELLQAQATIDAGDNSVDVIVIPQDTGEPESQNVVLTVIATGAYTPGIHSVDTIVITGLGISIVATVGATCFGRAPGVFVITRSGSTAAPLTVHFENNGEAVDGVDFASIGTSKVILAGNDSAQINIVPLIDHQTNIKSVDLHLLDSVDYTVSDLDTAEVTINRSNFLEFAWGDHGPVGPSQTWSDDFQISSFAFNYTYDGAGGDAITGIGRLGDFIYTGLSRNCVFHWTYTKVASAQIRVTIRVGSLVVMDIDSGSVPSGTSTAFTIPASSARHITMLAGAHDIPTFGTPSSINASATWDEV